MSDWYEKDDWYHPGPKTRKLIEDTKRRDAEICSRMFEDAQKHGFNSPNEQCEASRKKVTEYQLKIIKEVFSKNKHIKHAILFGRYLRQYYKIAGEGILTSDIDLILIVDDVDLKSLNKDISQIHKIFKKNRETKFYGEKAYMDYHTMDIFLMYDNLKYIGRPRGNKIKDDDKFNFFRIGNDYKVIF